MDFEEKLEKARVQNEYLKGVHAASGYAQWLYGIKGKAKEYRNNLYNRNFYTLFSSAVAALGNALYWLSARAIYLKEPPKGTTVPQLDVLYSLFFLLPPAFYLLYNHPAKKAERELKKEIGEDNFREKLQKIEAIQTPLQIEDEDNEFQAPSRNTSTRGIIRSSKFKPSVKETAGGTRRHNVDADVYNTILEEKDELAKDFVPFTQSVTRPARKV